jgi:hypothetical protein
MVSICKTHITVRPLIKAHTTCRKRYRTVEFIVEEAPWEPPCAVPTLNCIYLRVAWGEAAIARRIKDAGGQWRRDYKLWAIQYAQAEQLDLLDRMVEPGID